MTDQAQQYEFPPMPLELEEVLVMMRGFPEYLSTCGNYYTSDQMRDYASAAVEAAMAAPVALTDDQMWEIAKDQCGTVKPSYSENIYLDIEKPKELGNVVRAIIEATKGSK